MNDYPLTEDDIDRLSTISADATRNFSFAAGCFGFAAGIAKDLLLSSDPATKWTYFWWAVVVVLAVGVIHFFAEGRRHRKSRTAFVDRIKDTTAFA